MKLYLICLAVAVLAGLVCALLQAGSNTTPSLSLSACLAGLADARGAVT